MRHTGPTSRSALLGAAGTGDPARPRGAAQARSAPHACRHARAHAAQPRASAGAPCPCAGLRPPHRGPGLVPCFSLPKPTTPAQARHRLRSVTDKHVFVSSCPAPGARWRSVLQATGDEIKERTTESRRQGSGGRNAQRLQPCGSRPPTQRGPEGSSRSSAERTGERQARTRATRPGGPQDTAPGAASASPRGRDAGRSGAGALAGRARGPATWPGRNQVQAGLQGQRWSAGYM